MAKRKLFSAAQWRQIVDSAIDTAIITTDRDERVTSWNEGARRMLGWTQTDMIGQGLDRIFTENDRVIGKFSMEMADALSRGRGGEEGWRVNKDGDRFWATGELTPIMGDGEEVVGFIKILRNRTPQRCAEESLAAERRALEVLNRAGSALALETDLHKLVQIVTDAGSS